MPRGASRCALFDRCLHEELTQHSEAEVLNRMKMAGEESPVAQQMFEEMCARLHTDPAEVPGVMRSPEELAGLGQQQDRGMEQYNANIRQLEEEARNPGTLTEAEKQELQQNTYDLSRDIAVRQLQIDASYPERHLTPGALKAHVPLDKEQHPRTPTGPTYGEAYQDVLNQHLELAEWAGKAEKELKLENPGQDPTREDVLAGVADKYEFSKYAWRGLDVAAAAGMEGAEDLSIVTRGLYKPNGGSAGRPEAMAAEMGQKGAYEDAEGNVVAENVPEIRKVAYVSLLDRRLTELQDHLMIHGARDFSAGDSLPHRLSAVPDPRENRVPETPLEAPMHPVPEDLPGERPPLAPEGQPGAPPLPEPDTPRDPVQTYVQDSDRLFQQFQEKIQAIGGNLNANDTITPREDPDKKT